MDNEENRGKQSFDGVFGVMCETGLWGVGTNRSHIFNLLEFYNSISSIFLAFWSHACLSGSSGSVCT